MVQLKLSRLVAAIITGLLVSWYSLHYQTKWLSLGREAFLADQAHRFDTLFGRSAGLTIFGIAVLMLLIIGFYELLALALSKVIRPTVAAARNF